MDSLGSVCVRCGSERYRVQLPRSASISDLASLISARHLFSFPPRLVHRGRVLDCDSTLELCGVPSGALIVAIPPPSEIALRIVPGSCAPFALCAPVAASVSDLRSAVAERLSLHADQVRLIHRGAILEDAYSLSYYKLFNDATLYVALTKRLPQNRPRSSELIEDVRATVSRFISASPAQRRRLAADLTHLIDSPVLQAFVRIDLRAKLVVDDACMLLDATESPLTAELNEIVAAMNDRTMAQYEATVGGLRQLSNSTLKKSAPRAQEALPLRLDYAPQISEGPLPVWWSSRTADAEAAERSREKLGPIKERFSREVRALKRMGFADEAVILMALKETSGNVQRALKLLLKNIPNRC
jgi:hypothetical protein